MVAPTQVTLTGTSGHTITHILRQIKRTSYNVSKPNWTYNQETDTHTCTIQVTPQKEPIQFSEIFASTPVIFEEEISQ